MNKWELSSVILLVTAWAGCVYFLPGGGAFSVKGEIVYPQGQAIHNCQVQMLSLKGEKLLGPDEVSSLFHRSFVVAPYKMSYVEILCKRNNIAKFRVDYGSEVKAGQTSNRTGISSSVFGYWALLVLQTVSLGGSRPSVRRK